MNIQDDVQIETMPPQESPKKTSTSVWKELGSLLIKIGIICAIIAFMFTFVFGLILYDDPSMAPAIRDGDVVIFLRFTQAGYLPQDTVVVVFEGKRQVRRVVATAGDEVDITDRGLMINGALQNETRIFEETKRYQDGVEFPLVVPKGHVFVLGDSRENATDSRVYGCVKISDTLGKVTEVIRRRII